MLRSVRAICGILRSLAIYRGDRARRDAMTSLYARFVKPGDLAFDIGAHVGDRVAAFRRLGARVVALEPQPTLARLLRLIYAFDRNVTIVAAAVGGASGETKLMLNLANPTVATLSAEFVQAAHGAAGWEGQEWTQAVRVSVVTLDELIARFGAPAFIKIDVEGFEAQALAGLSRKVPALSFEFTTIQRDVAAACVARCAELGYARFNAALGESQAFVHADWQPADAIARWLAMLPHEANSGDIYALPA
jgi:FkbM family methyltransferase